MRRRHLRVDLCPRPGGTGSRATETRRVAQEPGLDSIWKRKSGIRETPGKATRRSATIAITAEIRKPLPGKKTERVDAECLKGMTARWIPRYGIHPAPPPPALSGFPPADMRVSCRFACIHFDCPETDAYEARLLSRKTLFNA